MYTFISKEGSAAPISEFKNGRVSHIEGGVANKYKHSRLSADPMIVCGLLKSQIVRKYFSKFLTKGFNECDFEFESELLLIINNSSDFPLKFSISRGEELWIEGTCFNIDFPPIVAYFAPFDASPLLSVAKRLIQSTAHASNDIYTFASAQTQILSHRPQTRIAK